MFKKPTELPKFNNRDIQALNRVAKATEAFTEAVNSKKGQAVVKEAEEYKDILKIVKTVQKADNYAIKIRRETDEFLAKAKLDLNEERQNLEMETSRRAYQAAVLTEKNRIDAEENIRAFKELSHRGSNLAAREAEVRATIKDQAHMREGLDKMMIQFRQRTKELDDREARLTAKINSIMNIHA